MNDVIVVGAGPAGLSAGIYCARARKKTLIIDKGDCYACKIDAITNLLGFPQGISGKELIRRGREQAEKFGCRLCEQEAVKIQEKDEGTFTVETDKETHEARAMILASGASRKKANIEGMTNFEGNGVAFCVQCDGYFFRDKEVAVIGSQNLAAREAMDLSDYTSHITLFTNGEKLDMKEEFVTWLQKNKIPIRKERIVAAVGDKELQGLRLENGETFACQGAFLAIGSSDAPDLARQIGIITEGNFIQVDKDQRTNVPRIYAAGDCTGGIRQISVAMGEGAIAATNLLLDLKKESLK